jgi:hypothetical protein
MTSPGGWCTNWGAYNAPAIWEMVAGEDDPEGWRQVNAWGNFEQAVAAQRKRLVDCRRALMDKWPPDSSEASRAFIQQLDELIASMDQSLQAASSTARGLAGIMQALANARRELEPIKREYDDKSSDWTLRMFDHAEDELDEKARGVMSRAELVVRDYTPMLKPPPEYRLAPRSDTSTPFDPSDTGGGGKAGGRDVGADAMVSPVPHDPPLPRPGADPVMPGNREWTPASPSGAGVGSGGPGLAGAPPPVTPPGGGGPTPPAPPGGPTPSTVGPGLGGPGPTGAGPWGPGIGPAVPPGMPVGPGGAGAGRRPSASAASGRLGGGTGPFPGGTQAGRAMPPGGVIGGAGAGGTPGATVPPAAGGGRGRRAEGAGGHGHGGDPDNPWEIEEGVPPVIEPAAESEPRHDPGPGVIGLGR